MSGSCHFLECLKEIYFIFHDKDKDDYGDDIDNDDDGDEDVHI